MQELATELADPSNAEQDVAGMANGVGRHCAACLGHDGAFIRCCGPCKRLVHPPCVGLQEGRRVRLRSPAVSTLTRVKVYVGQSLSSALLDCGRASGYAAPAWSLSRHPPRLPSAS